MRVVQRTSSRQGRSQQGSTLIEVLIAVLVLSIGLLGALKLQTEGVRLNADSRYTVLASAYAQDALDAIVHDVTGEASAWESITDATSSTGLTGRPKDWMDRMVADLPSPVATVSCSSTNASCTVTLKWTPPGRDQVTANYVIYQKSS